MTFTVRWRPTASAAAQQPQAFAARPTPTGSYDILVELFDARSGEYLASLGPESDSGLGYLPLEDYKRDAPMFDPPVAVSHGSGGGGSGGLLFSALLLVPLLLRRRRHRPEMSF
jgi:MYXO-CTERM domain-containing protein